MRTVILNEPGRLRLTDTDPPPHPPAGHALVRVRRVGVCGTDLHAFRGDQPFFEYPRILGHELGVTVSAIDTDDPAAARGKVRVGDRCAVEPYLNCGLCIACRRGRTNCCESLRVLGVHTDGGMRESIAVPIDKLHRSGAMSLDQLALVETLGIGAHAVSRAVPEAGEAVAVIGAGPIGLAVTQFALLAGADVAVVDVNERRLAFCGEHLGVTQCIDARGDVDAELTRTFGGDRPTIVFDATGSRDSMQRSFDLPAATGKLVLVGLVLGEIAFNDPSLHRRELTVLATRNSTADDFTRIISLIERGRIDTTPWITHRAALHDVPEAFPDWLDPARGTVKAMVEV